MRNRFDKSGFELTPAKLIITVAVLALIFIGVNIVGFVFNATYSEGERTGTISKFSHAGMFLKTWEGELIMGGVGSKTDSVANVWQFTVSDAKVVEQIQKAQRAGGVNTLHYKQTYFTSPLHGRTNYFVTSVVEGK